MKRQLKGLACSVLLAVREEFDPILIGRTPEFRIVVEQLCFVVASFIFILRALDIIRWPLDFLSSCTVRAFSGMCLNILRVIAPIPVQPSDWM